MGYGAVATAAAVSGDYHWCWCLTGVQLWQLVWWCNWTWGGYAEICNKLGRQIHVEDLTRPLPHVRIHQHRTTMHLSQVS
jgi:hypothetical protein